MAYIICVQDMIHECNAISKRLQLGSLDDFVNDYNTIRSN
jgi:hypothetical protein